MEKSESTSMVFNVLIKKESDIFIGHCLELDIVATANDLESVKSDLKDLIIAQVDYAFSNNNLNNLFHPAPSQVWEEFYACRTQSEERMELRSSYKKRNNIKTFVPPWIIAKTCLSYEVYHA